MREFYRLSLRALPLAQLVEAHHRFFGKAGNSLLALETGFNNAEFEVIRNTIAFPNTKVLN